jgi:Mrp family chromosome partitioning ATPase
MCDGGASLAIAMMVMTAATTAYQMKAQRDQAAKQKELMEEQAQAQRAAALAASQADADTAKAQTEEVRTQTETEKFDRMRQSQKEAAKIRVAASEAGVFGGSVEDQLGSALSQTGHDLGIIDYNEAKAFDQINRNMRQSDMAYANRMTEAKLTDKAAKMHTGPSAGMSALTIGSAGLQGFGQGYQLGSKLSQPGVQEKTPYIPAR